MADQQEERSLSSEIEEFTYKRGRDSTSDVRSALLVVATLIATVTFQAGLNPPGGVWQESCPTDSPTPTPTPTQDNSPTPTQVSRLTQSHEAGKAILGSNRALFNTFLFSNTVAFSASGSIIEYLVQGFPFQILVRIALFFLGCTYSFSIIAVHPDEEAVSSIGFYTAVYLPLILATATSILRKIEASCARGWSRIS